MAERLLKQCGQDAASCINSGFRLAIGRQPKPREQEILQRLYEEQLKHFENDPSAADQYLKVGDHPADKSIPPQQLAATAVLANALMNLDEFVNER